MKQKNKSFVLVVLLVLLSCGRIDVQDALDIREPYGQWINDNNEKTRFLTVTKDHFFIGNHMKNYIHNSFKIVGIKKQIGVAKGVIYTDHKLIKRVYFDRYLDRIGISYDSLLITYEFELL